MKNKFNLMKQIMIMFIILTLMVYLLNRKISYNYFMFKIIRYIKII